MFNFEIALLKPGTFQRQILIIKKKKRLHSGTFRIRANISICAILPKHTYEIFVYLNTYKMQSYCLFIDA